MTAKSPTMEEAMEAVRTMPALTIAEAAVLMRVSTATALRRAAKGDLPAPVTAARLGQRWIVPSAGVRAFLGIEVAA